MTGVALVKAGPVDGRSVGIEEIWKLPESAPMKSYDCLFALLRQSLDKGVHVIRGMGDTVVYRNHYFLEIPDHLNFAWICNGGRVSYCPSVNW